MNIDADDNLWVACWGGSQVIHVDPTTGRLSDAQKGEQPAAGSLFQITNTGARGQGEFEDKRNVVYQNSQFNLENASKEALISTNSLPFKEDLLSETLLNTPMFGIPNPSLRIRHNPSLTSATESVDGMDLNTTLLPIDAFKRERKRSRSPSRGSNNSQSFAFQGRLSATKIGEGLFEETVNEIIAKGGEDFRNKYSSWVWDVFHTNLMKMKSLLLSEFNEKLKVTLDEREDEVAGMQKQYREKLAEFDATTEGFQKMIDNLYQENQRVLKAKDFVIEKLKKEFIECKNHFEKDLRRQMQSYRKEAEVEKIELQTRNDELMKIMLTDSSKSGLEESFKREIESLHKMIKALTTQNDVLHQQLDEANNSVSDIRQKNMEVLQSQLDNAKLEILELRKRLQYADREKEDLTISHNQQIAKLNRKMQESSTRYDHRLREVTEDMESLRKKHAKEAKELKNKLANQDAEHGQMLSQVKNQYGQQVMSLSQAVSELQTELKQSGTAPKFPY
ncbi:Paramyosin [Orchesella cincta]|uniref:Paramyosin n=1 Tax=Orchesella cincta TaxID=48709 RepID=A0A1D2MYV6_ORCCI|nr:Paramyosin [Orchesella cincta]